MLHLVVVTSFLTLALTGLPLKFHGTGWGEMLMDAFGGAARAHSDEANCAYLVNSGSRWRELGERETADGSPG